MSAVAEARKRLSTFEAALAVAVSRKTGWLAPHDLRQMRIDALHKAVEQAKRDLVAAEMAHLAKTGRLAFKHRASKIVCRKPRARGCPR
jgi:hypothetical protein